VNYKHWVPVRTSTASHVLDISVEGFQTGVGTNMQNKKAISPCSHALQTSYSRLQQQQQMSSFSLGDHVGCHPLCDGVGGSGAPASDSVLPPSASAQQLVTNCGCVEQRSVLAHRMRGPCVPVFLQWDSFFVGCLSWCGLLVVSWLDDKNVGDTVVTHL
jgi:hypothetical protein